jgi:uncharacterized membrane protein
MHKRPPGGGADNPRRRRPPDLPMTDPAAAPASLPKHRVEALSDGVYAIALTLLVLELKLPSLPAPAGDDVLRQALLGQLPRLASWLLSFVVLALFWVGQQRLFALLRELSTPLLRIELAHLALISLFPFTTAVIGAYGGPTGALLYSAHLAAVALLSLARFGYVARHPELHHAGVGRGVLDPMRGRVGLLVGCSLLALALARWLPGWNLCAMLLMAPAGRWAARRRR